VVLLVGGPLVYASVRLDALLTGYVNGLLPELSAKLGRPVRLGRISTAVLAGLEVQLVDLSVGADPTLAATVDAERGPLLQVRSVRLRVAALRAILSFGRSVRIRELSVDGLSLQLVHYPDGTLNLDPLLARLRSEPPAKREPLDATTRAVLLGLRIDALLLRDAALHFTDVAPRGGSGASTVSISKLNFSLRDFQARRPFAGTLTAAVLGPAPNFDLRAGFGPLPPRLDGPPPLDRVVLQMARTDLAPVAPFLDRIAPGVEGLAVGARLEAVLGGAVAGGSGATTVRGGLNAWGVRFHGGIPFDVALTADMAADAARGDITLNRLGVALGAVPNGQRPVAERMSLEARGRLLQLTSTPRFEAVRVASRGLDFDLLRRYYPLLDKSTGVELHGGWSISAHASGTNEGQTFTASVDLTPASLRLAAAPGGPRPSPSPQRGKGRRPPKVSTRRVAPTEPSTELLLKPSGVPLKLEVSGQAVADSLVLRRMVLQVADWLLEAHGTVKRFAAPVVELDATATAPGIGRLVRLLPPVAAALPPETRVRGALGLEAHVTATLPPRTAPPGAMLVSQARLQLELSDANVAVAGARLLGHGRVSATASTGPGRLGAAVDVALDALEAIYQDVVRKRAGVPLWTKARFVQRGTVADPTVELRVAELSAQAKAHVEGLAAPGGPTKAPPADTRPSFDATVAIPPFALAGVASMFPSLARSPVPPLRVGAVVHARGRMGLPESFAIDLRELSVRGARASCWPPRAWKTSCGRG
jgi:hypothetical protein